ncbi:hypothetical protein E1193_25060 [Micromonospora sp. KC606]|nr:hypothetical protein E1193_25060 [Micromonospora sp. KC606]
MSPRTRPGQAFIRAPAERAHARSDERPTRGLIDPIRRYIATTRRPPPACLPACLRACVPACLRACVPACLRAAQRDTDRYRKRTA